MQHSEVTAFVAEVRRLKIEASLLGRIDRNFLGTDFLQSLIFSEVSEVREELALDGNSRFSLHRLRGEVADTNVLTVSRNIADRNSADLTNGAHLINGQGKRSDALDRFCEYILNSEDDPAALVEAFRIIISMLYHISPISVVESMRQTVDKVLANRPPELYSDQENGVLLNDAEALQKYIFLEKAMRLIRKTVGRTLVDTDWRPYLKQLRDWRNEQLNLAIIDRELDSVRRHVTASGLYISNAADNSEYAGTKTILM
jgi:hypothetical protein